MTTKVVHIKSGYKYDVYIGRTGHGKDGYFGNPFVINREVNRTESLHRYKLYFMSRVECESEFRRRILELKDKILGCFCAPQRCHGHIIAEWLDSQSNQPDS